MTKILVHGITKEAMKAKLYNKSTNFLGDYGIEETHLTKKREK